MLCDCCNVRRERAERGVIVLRERAECRLIVLRERANYKSFQAD
jgi:hypothetical protein